MMHRVLISGGRDNPHKHRVYEALDTLMQINGMFFIIEGGASGPDTFSKEWALERGFPYAEVPAHWNSYRKAAGTIRNDWMTRLFPTYAVVFEGGNGTADMANKLQDNNVVIWRPDLEEDPPPFPQLQLIAMPV
jgi:hypothetical protein